MFRPTPHPVLRVPTAAEMALMTSDDLRAGMVRREEKIRAEQLDPFNIAYEPPIWLLCDAILGFDWVPIDLADRIRHKLGIKRPKDVLLINGGNRAGKTEYAMRRVLRVLRRKPAARAWCCHETTQMSIEYHQGPMHRLLPKEWTARDVRSKTTYIAFKQKTGFSEGKFVLPPMDPGKPGSACEFLSYDMDPDRLEGGNLDIIWDDEMVPPEWVETQEFRIAERSGKLIVTFTPKKGYSATVKLFQDAARVCLESPGYLLPRDGRKPEVARALGLTQEQLEELYAADEGELVNGRKQPRAATAMQSIPEDVVEGPPMDPNDRTFERVPRVLESKCESMNRGVVFFHSSDNPYGNPKSVAAMVLNRSIEGRRERFYGVANRLQSSRFPKFNERVHVIRPELIPGPKEGTNRMIVDPATRNFFMLWFRHTAEALYVYREWPGNYFIEGVGVPGPWAVPDGRKPDGRPGPAQKSFGWGYRAYKREIARLEGWRDATRERPPDMEEGDWVDGWSQWNGADEIIRQRFIDSRFASEARMENDRPTTILTDFSRIGLHFTPTTGGDTRESIAEGVQKINDALDYNEEKEVDYFNRPRLYVSSDCTNLIFALSSWTGLTDEGKANMTGASKDPIDCLRYYFLAGCSYVGPVEEESEPGMHYA